ncbi:alpha-ribazole phosphatase [Desulfotomaculum copahuensis]|uniref:alpha-ribazole phosphatase n=1 Tax=Desulfotomaculum copahuensis TaxID=1838280 RepID=UPI001248E0A5|nr:alpha-ribazole phosphatase [Desulfotomaculum copahuensis]
MFLRIFLVRHGETAWNAKLRFQGHVDVPLSGRGREQARALAVRLEKENFAAAYASDLGRAVETAGILTVPHNLAVQQLTGLREINFGAWEGLTAEQIRARYDKEIRQWWDKPLQTRIPGGETLSEVAARVTAEIRRIVENRPGEQVLVVCHGGPIRTIVASILGMDLNQYWRLRLDNACLSIIDFPAWDRGMLTLFNDCSHLAGGE